MAIVVADKATLPILILIHPLEECITQIVHFLCDQQRCPFVDYTVVITDADLAMIQSCLKNIKCTRFLCPIGGVHFHLIGVNVVCLLDFPLSCCRRILNDSL